MPTKRRHAHRPDRCASDRPGRGDGGGHRYRRRVGRNHRRRSCRLLVGTVGLDRRRQPVPARQPGSWIRSAETALDEFVNDTAEQHRESQRHRIRHHTGRGSDIACIAVGFEDRRQGGRSVRGCPARHLRRARRHCRPGCRCDASCCRGPGCCRGASAATDGCSRTDRVDPGARPGVEATERRRSDRTGKSRGVDGTVGSDGLDPPRPHRARRARGGRAGRDVLGRAHRQYSGGDRESLQSGFGADRLGDRPAQHRLPGLRLGADQQHQLGQRVRHRRGRHVVQRRERQDSTRLRRHLQRAEHDRELAFQRAAAQHRHPALQRPDPGAHRPRQSVHSGRPKPGVLHRLRGHQHSVRRRLRQRRELRQLLLGEVLGHPRPLDHELLRDLAIQPEHR